MTELGDFRTVFKSESEGRVRNLECRPWNPCGSQDLPCRQRHLTTKPQTGLTEVRFRWPAFGFQRRVPHGPDSPWPVHLERFQPLSPLLQSLGTPCDELLAAASARLAGQRATLLGSDTWDVEQSHRQPAVGGQAVQERP
ncbi:unnamed protein product, partial [Symbiodinium necroappetens]